MTVASRTPLAGTKLIEFDCPGCGRHYREPRHAAGKQTQCPRCETRFVIPAAPERTSPAAEQPSPDALETTIATADLAAGSGETSPGANGLAAARFINRRTIIPIGLMLMTLGGLVSIVSVICAFEGYQRTLIGQLGLGGLGGDADLTKPVREYARLLNELGQDPTGRARPPAGQPPADDPQHQGIPSARSASTTGGTALLYGGVAGTVLGSLLSFAGGIFLLAGLIGRFLRPQGEGATG